MLELITEVTGSIATVFVLESISYMDTVSSDYECLYKSIQIDDSSL